MKKGGNPRINQPTATVIRHAGFLLPTLLFFYGLLLVMGAVSSPNFTGPTAFFCIAVSWVLLGVYQFVIPPRSRRASVVRLSLFHLVALLYLLFVSGFAMPFTVGWVMLLLASFVYIGNTGLYMSMAIFVAGGVVDIFIHAANPSSAAQTVLYMVATIAVGSIAAALSESQQVDYAALDRSQAKELLQRDRILTIVNNLADAVISTDRNGVIQLYNAATLNLIDTNTSLDGKKIDDILRVIDSEKQHVHLLRLLKSARSVQNRDDLSATISGETIHLSTIYSPIRSANSHESNGNDGYIIILRDITKQKSLEEERDEFISVVSHELRTPITIAEGVLSNVQIMMDRDDIPKTTMRENVHMAHDQIVFLARMVNDLSTLSRAERGVADEAELIDVRALINDLYAEYAPQAEAKGLGFNLDIAPQPGAVMASRLYLKELLQNFVTNAIKYTKKGDVTVIVQKLADDQLRFTVKDTGIGISKSDQAHIFDKFYRSEDYRTRETGGTGLGLYVAIKLSRKLGTQIELTSRLNHGSSFGFTLPAAPNSQSGNA
ncbi:MAG: ATP-binding protein [Candidatus Saccharimonas sp.]